MKKRKLAMVMLLSIIICISFCWCSLETLEMSVQTDTASSWSEQSLARETRQTVVEDIQSDGVLHSFLLQFKSEMNRRFKGEQFIGCFYSALAILFRIAVIPTLFFAALTGILQYQIPMRMIILSFMQRQDGKI